MTWKTPTMKFYSYKSSRWIKRHLCPLICPYACNLPWSLLLECKQKCTWRTWREHSWHVHVITRALKGAGESAYTFPSLECVSDSLRNFSKSQMSVQGTLMWDTDACYLICRVLFFTCLLDVVINALKDGIDLIHITNPWVWCKY